jgi:predicted transposase YbfD/YdcC
MTTAPLLVPEAAAPFLPASTPAVPVPVHTTVTAAWPSLVEALAAVPDPRGRQGRRHPGLPLLLSLVYAFLCGKFHPDAIAEWVDAHYSAWLREALGFTQAQRPCRTTFYLFARRLDWAALETALSGWIRAVAATQGFGLDPEAVAWDGKEVRGVRRMSDAALLLVSAFTHESDLTLALRSFPEGQEQAAVQALLRELTLKGRVVTLDALHTQRDTSQVILDQGGDYVLTAKGNQAGLRAAIQDCLAPWQAAAQDREVHRCSERGHGRCETRTLVAVSVSATEVDWPGVQQVFCLTRQVYRRRTGKCATEVVWGVTSLSRAAAGPERLLRLHRGHWRIENRSHWVRDVVCREDGGLAVLDNTAEVLAVLRTVILNVLRLHRVPNLGKQFRANVDRPRDAARFLGLSVPARFL